MKSHFSLLMLICLIFATSIFAQTQTDSIHVDSINTHKSKPRISVSLGLGRAYGLAGCMLSLDLPNNLGIDLSIGGFPVPTEKPGVNVTFSLRYNSQYATGPYFIIPKVSFYIHSKPSIWIPSDSKLQPGIAFSALFRGYFNKHIFVDNSFGVEYNPGKSESGQFNSRLWPHSGLGLGYTFSDNSNYTKWTNKARITWVNFYRHLIFSTYWNWLYGGIGVKFMIQKRRFQTERPGSQCCTCLSNQLS